MSIKITEYMSPESFLANTLSWLEMREVENSLPIGLALREQVQAGLYPPARFISLEDPFGLAIAGLMTYARDMILACDRREPKPLVESLVDHLVVHGWPVPGVLAAPSIAKFFSDRWVSQTGEPVQLESNQRCYALKQVAQPAWPPGAMRQADRPDLETISRWIYEFDIEALHILDPQGYRQRAETRIAEQTLYVWEDGGLAAMAVKSRPTRFGATVGLVYTPPERRKRGYASAIVAALSQALLDQGYQYCSLFTDLANPTSNKIYQQIGYRPISDFDRYAIGAP